MTSQTLLVILLAAAPFVGACASGGQGPGSDRKGEESVRVLVYNIHAGKDADGEESLRRIAALIRDREADVVLLQEVDRGTGRSGRTDQPSELARLSGLHAAFGKTLDYDGGEYGIALLSRWPIAGDTLVPLPVEPPRERAGGSREPRGVHHVRIEGPGGTLHVLNTHLDPSPESRWRRQELETVLDVARELRREEAMVLLGGDFNARPRSAAIGRVLEDGWRDAWKLCGRGDGGTYPAGEPDRRIDYLFLPPDVTCHRAEAPSADGSDHRPLLVEVSPEGD